MWSCRTENRKSSFNLDFLSCTRCHSGCHYWELRQGGAHDRYGVALHSPTRVELASVTSDFIPASLQFQAPCDDLIIRVLWVHSRQTALYFRKGLLSTDRRIKGGSVIASAKSGQHLDRSLPSFSRFGHLFWPHWDTRLLRTAH